jgi:hypothetical protein
VAFFKEMDLPWRSHSVSVSWYVLLKFGKSYHPSHQRSMLIHLPSSKVPVPRHPMQSCVDQVKPAVFVPEMPGKQCTQRLLMLRQPSQYKFCTIALAIFPSGNEIMARCRPVVTPEWDISSARRVYQRPLSLRVHAFDPFALVPKQLRYGVPARLF